jgi:hypothetical protein
MGNKVIKSVSFNVTNADDTAILKAVKRRNFSGYVKGLILADIRAKEATTGAQEASEPQKPNQPTAAERLEALKRQKGEHKPAQTKPFINQPKN